MRILRLAVFLASALTLTSCGTVSRLFDAAGRTLHLGSENTKTPESFRLEAREVRESLADGAKIDVKPQTDLPELAQR